MRKTLEQEIKNLDGFRAFDGAACLALAFLTMIMSVLIRNGDVIGMRCLLALYTLFTFGGSIAMYISFSGRSKMMKKKEKLLEMREIAELVQKEMLAKQVSEEIPCKIKEEGNLEEEKTRFGQTC